MVFPRASLPEFDDGNVPSHGLVAVGSYPPPVTSPVTELAWLVSVIPYLKRQRFSASQL